MPTCKGKLFEDKAWIISMNKFIDKLCGEKGLSACNIIPRKIDRETLDASGMKFFEHELLNDAKPFFNGVASLQFMFRHLMQVGDMKNLDETGTKIVKSWFDKMHCEVNRELDQLHDKSNLIASLHNQLVNGDSKTDANECLNVACRQLVEIYDKLVPEELENGKAVLSCEAIKKWQKQLLSVQDEVFVMYLRCCSYVINSN